MPTRRAVLRGLGGAGVAAATGAVPQSALAVGGASKDPVFTFASLPDFFNGDVGDLSVMPTWDGGANSVNQYWKAGIDRCLGAVAAHRPDAVFVAGDAVEGRWNIDSDGRELFGPVSQGRDAESIEMCETAITSAGNVYYEYYKRLFKSRGLTLYPTIGDHELLDDRPGKLNDRWSPSGFHEGTPDNRYYLVEHCKRAWAGHFTRPGGTAQYHRRPEGTGAEWTAYAVSFADALTLITVDMFMHHSGGVRLGVFHGQLRWLTQEIRRAKRKGHVVVVQGHMPMVWPTRHFSSGRLRLPEGRQSTFYRTLDREGVDLFLCGEVHDSTAIQHGRRRSAPDQPRLHLPRRLPVPGRAPLRGRPAGARPPREPGLRGECPDRHLVLRRDPSPAHVPVVRRAPASRPDRHAEPRGDEGDRQARCLPPEARSATRSTSPATSARRSSTTGRDRGAPDTVSPVTCRVP